MKNLIQKGDVLTLAAPYARESGEGAQVGALFGVAITKLANAESGAFQITGVVELTKVGSQAWTVGAPIFWDNTNKRCTTVGEDNKLIGAATEAVADGAGDTSGKVLLMPNAVPAINES